MSNYPMKLIIGLGNPGEQYEKNRHNIGFMVVDELARKLSAGSPRFIIKKNIKTDVLETKFLGEELVLAKPQTFMNASGFVVAGLANFYKIDPSNVWVIHDDLDLPLGKMKIVQSRGSAGHQGVISIIRELGTIDFVRFRVGIGHPAKGRTWKVSGGKLVSENVMHREVERFVLEDFAGKEAVEAGKMIKRMAQALEYALRNSPPKAMDKFNAK